MEHAAESSDHEVNDKRKETEKFFDEKPARKRGRPPKRAQSVIEDEEGSMDQKRKKREKLVKERMGSKHVFESATAKKKERSVKEGKGSKRKSDPIKAQYVNGAPVNPCQNEPVVPNPYNYDPLSELQPLGVGQLQSCYRNSKNNIAPPKEKKIYKLEHRSSQEITPEEGENVSAIPLYGQPLFQ